MENEDKFFFYGFIFGNIFGSFLTYIRLLLFWDGFIILLCLIYFEFFSKIQSKLNIWNSELFLFQSGVLISFFIDAYKVGS
uniref:Ycf20 n=1 Tax=Codium simulans TaxID=589376 RepID=A0A1I9LKK9_9CHLO|nr:Ycf20 [Codium simulans]ANJ70870.1 Ycf20 [Codium simulans]